MQVLMKQSQNCIAHLMWNRGEGMSRQISLKQYVSFFRLRFSMGLQYRTAAVAGMVTQFVWGAMEIMVYNAFYKADASAFPMTFEAVTSYIWFQQAFLALFASWTYEDEIFTSISNGNVAYELCRPVRIYEMWFARGVALRLSRAALRCMPILLFAALLPEPYGLTLPNDKLSFVCFIPALILSLFVVVAFSNLIYVLTFFMVSSQGLRVFSISLMDFFTGAVIPIPFFPEGVRKIMEVLPFAAMQNVPLRIYSGDITNGQIPYAFGLQIFRLQRTRLMRVNWLILLFQN